MEEHEKWAIDRGHEGDDEATEAGRALGVKLTSCDAVW